MLDAFAARPLRFASCALALALLAGTVRGDTPAGAHLFDLKSGTLTYVVRHKLHEVKGTTAQLEGRALVQPDGSVRVQVRAKVASFDSGNANRDGHMREVTHELQHPYVTVHGTLSGVALPLAGPAEKTLQATVELNGERQSVPVQVKLSAEGNRIRAQLSFPISLDAFKVSRPELLLIKVDDEVKLAGELVFEETK